MLSKRLTALLCALNAAACFAAPACPPATQSSASDTLLLVHASVVPMDRERVLADQSVLIRGGRIAAIGPAGTIDLPAGAACLDAGGKFLMPALADMHVHLLGHSWKAMLSPKTQAAAGEVPYDDFLLPYIANGVTLVQVMSGTPEDLQVRERIGRGEILGPRLVLGRMVDAPKKAWPPPLNSWVANGAEARAAIEAAKQAGYDKIKVYSFLDKESYDAVTQTAGELKMDVIGHIPVALSVEYVLNAKQKLVAHAEEVMKHAHGDYSAAKIDYYARLMADRGVWMSPTLVTTRSMLELFDDSQRAMGVPEAAYFRHPIERDVWSFLANNLYLPIPQSGKDAIRAGFHQFQKPFTKAFFDRGGRILIGTDSPWPGLVPGFALHRELGELTAIGLTPYQALRAATVDAYDYLGESAGAGTIEVGKRSDLILVEHNPLQDVKAAGQIRGVLLRGRWLGKDELDAKMKALAGAPQPQPSNR